METFINEYTIDEISPSTEKYFTEDTLFFDIECTGLSPRKSFIYMIGYATRKGAHITVKQLLAENEHAERTLLEDFISIIKPFSTLLGFNSTRFDENFILERCKKYDLACPIKQKRHIDMYLASTKAKCILTLPNFKQKTLEAFLGLNRDDKYDGGQLIPVYKKYAADGDIISKELILLHNLEDVKGMIHCLDIFAYIDFLTSDFSDINISPANKEIIIDAKSTISLKMPINKKREYGMYIIKGNHIHLCLNTYTGSLSTWLEDYKNYYYLISEDIIVPKVIGSSIDKENRKNATKADCKVSKDSTYLQLPDKMVIPTSIKIFKSDYKSSQQYIDIDDLSETLIKSIITFMLKH